MKKILICNDLPTTMCHGSCIVALPGGGLICAWFGGSREGEPDVDIYVSTCKGKLAAEETEAEAKGCKLAGAVATGAKTNNGWSKPFRVTNEKEACWNPSFLITKTCLNLFYKAGNKIASWRTLVRKAQLTPEGTIDSKGFGTAQELVPGDSSGGRGPVRTKAIVLKSGRICAGASLEQADWTAFCDYSDDGGVTWQRSNVVGLNLAGQAGQRTAPGSCPIPLSEQSFYGRGVIQPSLWQAANGWVHMYLRSTEGYIYHCLSKDEGTSFTAPVPTKLPNNNSGFDLLACQDALYLVCNPVGGNWGSRTPLTLFKSTDDGVNWVKVGDVETAPGEYSYPSLTADERGLWCSYTYNRVNIAVSFLSWQELFLY